MNVPRYLKKIIEQNINKQKVIRIFGTRRTGKSTLLKDFFTQNSDNAIILQGEDMHVQELLKTRTIKNYQKIIGQKTILMIDEAQVIPEIGNILKLMIDNIEPLNIIVTGSSSFDLQNSSGQPLVGRNIDFQMFPIAQKELSEIENLLDTKNNLEERIIYGSYPELWHLENLEEKQNYLKQLVENYLLKDILMYENVLGSDILYKLLQLLAFQCGNLVSTTELGNALQINKATVYRYLDLLSKVYIIFPISGFSKNLRKEITKSKKWYFYDNGIRNALINNFNILSQRNDVGQLWEQYFISERIKFNSSNLYYPQYHFWRTYDGQEIDLLEIDNYQKISAWETKWKSDKAKIPGAFAKAYSEAEFTLINQNNYLDFIS